MAESHRNPGPQAAQAIRQALEILNRASTDWRGNGAGDAGPLHWPVAVNLARREFAQALESIQAEAQLAWISTRRSFAKSEVAHQAVRRRRIPFHQGTSTVVSRSPEAS
ncbi:MAG: hypothetical protein ACYCV6_18670, partial [Steroidobacteraceae bacterium]